jgi:hypothetical protein
MRFVCGKGERDSGGRVSEQEVSTGMKKNSQAIV